MKILIVSEGKHEQSGALETLIRRLTKLEFSHEHRALSDRSVGRIHGKGHGYSKRAISWLLTATRDGFDALVLLVDQDDDRERHKHIAEAQRHVKLATLPRAMGVPVLTFDAWMLADEKAISLALSGTVQRQPDPEDIRDPKGRAESLRDNAGSTLSARELYAAIAEEVDLHILTTRCPLGFEPFAQRLREMTKQLT